MANVRLNVEDKERFKKHAKTLGVSLKEYMTLCSDRFERLKINPKNEATNEELKTIFISFIRKQEQDYHEVNRKNIRYLIKELEKINIMLNNLSFDVKILKNKK